MKKKTKLDNDYEYFNSEIEKTAHEKIEHIESETDSLIEEANKVEANIESTLKVSEKETAKKKVNSQL
jgi:hypothetical protein